MDDMQSNTPFRDDFLAAGKSAGLTFVLLQIISLFVFCQQTLDAPNITQIGRDFGLTGASVDEIIGGKSFMWQMVVISVSLVLFGYLADMTNRKILLAVSLVSSGISYFLASFTDSPAMFILLRSLGGIGIGGFVPVMFSIIGDMFTSRSRPAASGIFIAIVNIGFGIGFILGAAVGSETAFGWRVSFQVQSLVLTALSLVFIFAGKLPQRGLADMRESESTVSSEYKGRISLSDIRKILSIRTNLIFIISCIISTMPMGYVQRFMVDYFAEDIGLGTGTATVLLLVVLSGTLIGDLIGGLFGDFLRARNARYPSYLSAAALFLGCMLFLVFFSMGIPVLAAASALLPPIAVGFAASAFVEVPTPVSKAIMLDVNLPENRGTISAFIQITAQIGFGLGALIGTFGDDLAVMLGVIPARLFNFKIAMLMYIPVGLSWILISYTVTGDEKRAKEMMKDRIARNL